MRIDCCPGGRYGNRHVGNSSVRDDQLYALAALDERVQVSGDRRQSASAVNQNRHLPLGRQREHRRQSLVPE